MFVSLQFKPILGRFLIGSLPIAMVVKTRLPENFYRSSPIMTPRTQNHPSLKSLYIFRPIRSDDFEELDRSPEQRGYVLVEFRAKKAIFYIGKVIEVKDCGGDLVVSFLRKSDKIAGKFVQPNVSDVTSVPEKDIKLILPQPVTLGFNKRQKSLISFEVDFWFINIKSMYHNLSREKRNYRNSARRREAIRKRERRVVETDEERSRRLSTLAQHSQERRAEEREEQRNCRLSVMVQHARERRLNVTEGKNDHQIQDFYAARTALYPIVEEHNCGEMDNLWLKCGGLYFRDEKNTRGIYTHCCHNGNIIELYSGNERIDGWLRRIISAFQK
ncbi:hypothetical protein AVEN_23333-1 [Araneus ventricosus]|uniref:STPR domain-containing protein n=1 Tax=Araneus ventricosus TaxID=182803 RepID=A0A4Y2FV59_ARAVE|nr:hypothetical protein AVEN_23333-1 [Araneus ventricosus]